MARACTLSENEGLRCLQRNIEALSACTANSGGGVKDVHDLRIACRRGRVMLAEFNANFPPATRRAAKRLLQKTGRKLGRARELDVSLALLSRWETADLVRDAAIAEVRRRLEADRLAEGPNVSATFERFAGDELSGRFLALESNFRPSGACHLRHAKKRLAKRLKRLHRQYRVWSRSRADEDLHLLRLRFKTLRYSLEIHGGLYGVPAKTLLNALIGAQDALGRWNDFRLLHDRVREIEADAPPELHSPIAALAGAIEAETVECVAAMDKGLRPFFARDAMHGYKAMIAAAKRPCCRDAC